MSFFNTNKGEKLHMATATGISLSEGGGLPLEWLGAMVHLQCFLRWRHENQDDGTFDVRSSRTLGWVAFLKYFLVFTTKIRESDPKLTGGIFFENGGWWSQPPT